MSKPRAVLIVNGTARRAAEATRPDVLAALGRRWTIDVAYPSTAYDAAIATRAAVADGVDAIIAAGGDGSASIVASAMTHSGVPLGLMPVGTANDFARALGTPRDPLGAAHALTTATAQPVDVLRVGERCVCTVAGFGIVADSAMTAARLKERDGALQRAARLMGASIYRATATAALFTRRPLSRSIAVDVTLPNGTTERIALASPGFFIANARFLGGGLALPNVSGYDDGLCELLLVQDVARMRLLDAFTRLTLRLPISDRVLRVVPARAVRIVADRDESLVGDGDVVACGREMTVSLDPAALPMLA